LKAHNLHPALHLDVDIVACRVADALAHGCASLLLL
jgi:hypothetical protein